MIDQGLFEEPERVDWDVLAGRRSIVRMSWGNQNCVIRGRAPVTKDGFPQINVELLPENGEHEHSGACELTKVSPGAVAIPR